MEHPPKEHDYPEGRSALFLFLFTNVPFLLGVAIAWTVLWVVASIRLNDWSWFSRAGSVLGILGGVLSCRPVLRFTKAERIRIRNMTIIEVFSREELEDQERDSGGIIAGVVLLISGTLIWAYGDLLGKL